MHTALDGSTTTCAISHMSRRDDTPTGASRATPIVLAAGAGSRFSDIGHKLVARLPATDRHAADTVIGRALRAALDAALGPVVVVTGRLGADELGLAAATDEDRLVAMHNANWARGQATSLRIGLDAAADRGSSVAVVGLADQPGITAAAWREVADAADETAPIAVATYDGRRANPVALHRSIWHLLPSEGDEGARSLMRLHPELVREVPCTGSPTDIDTAEDLRRWQSS